MEQRYAGVFRDHQGGMTHLGRIVRDAWVFGLLPETQDAAGWTAGQLQALYEQVYAEWDKYGHLPSRLPDALRERYVRIHQQAIEQARAQGWNPELGEDD